MKIRNKAIATGVSVALTLTMTPVVALADEAASRDAASSQAVASDGALQDSALAAETVEESAVVVEEDAEAAAPEAAQDAAPAAGDASIAQDAAASDALPDWIPEGGYDKAEFYSEAEEDGIEMLSDSARAASVYPVKISKDMLYFGAYEGGTYDRTFSYGDGYHALGFYQFDHRYGLQNFLIACYNYDPRSSRCSSSSSPFPLRSSRRPTPFVRSTKRASTISRRWARPSMKHGWRRRMPTAKAWPWPTAPSRACRTAGPTRITTCPPSAILQAAASTSPIATMR